MIAFVSSAYLAWRAEQRQRRDLLRERFEEVHSCLAAIRRGNHGCYQDMRAFIQHKLVPKAFPLGESHDRLMTLVDIYGKKLRKQLDEAVNADMAWTGAVRSVLNPPLSETRSSSQQIAELQAKWAAADEALARFQNIVAEEARRLVA